MMHGCGRLHRNITTHISSTHWQVFIVSTERTMNLSSFHFRSAFIGVCILSLLILLLFSRNAPSHLPLTGYGYGAHGSDLLSHVFNRTLGVSYMIPADDQPLTARSSRRFLLSTSRHGLISAIPCRWPRH